MKQFFKYMAIVFFAVIFTTALGNINPSFSFEMPAPGYLKFDTQYPDRFDRQHANNWEVEKTNIALKAIGAGEQYYYFYVGRDWKGPETEGEGKCLVMIYLYATQSMELMDLKTITILPAGFPNKMIKTTIDPRIKLIKAQIIELEYKGQYVDPDPTSLPGDEYCEAETVTAKFK